MTATVIAAGVTFAVMVVMVTFYVGIKSKRTAKRRFDCGIAGSADSAEKLNTCLGKCHRLL